LTSDLGTETARAIAAEAGIITTVGYDEMGAIASRDYLAYKQEVETALINVDNMPSKIDTSKELLFSLYDAMAIGEFPVTIDRKEYVDADSLQVAIDVYTAELENVQRVYDNASVISSNYGPVNIVNFESWVDAKVTDENNESLAQLTSDLSDEVARAIAAEAGLDSKIVDIISNTDITSIDSFSEVVNNINSALDTVINGASAYVVSNRPTMTEFNESTDGLTTSFTANIITGTHIVFLNGLMQFEGRDYAEDQMSPESLIVEFYTSPSIEDVLNVYGVQTGIVVPAFGHGGRPKK
jgi:hypothetical protein